MEQVFIPGSVWELSVNANCIPAGCYRLEEINDEFLIFSVGSKISFGLTKDFYSPFLKPVLDPAKRKTSSDAFLETYAQLFHLQSFATPRSQGMTYCVMDSRLQRKFRKLTRLHRFPAPLSAMH
jgi:hypothetical protein